MVISVGWGGSGCVAFLLGWCGWWLWWGDFYSQVFLRLCYCCVVMGVASFGVLVVTLMCFYR